MWYMLIALLIPVCTFCMEQVPIRMPVARKQVALSLLIGPYNQSPARYVTQEEQWAKTVESERTSAGVALLLDANLSPSSDIAPEAVKVINRRNERSRNALAMVRKAQKARTLSTSITSQTPASEKVNPTKVD